ncbi:MAG: hypothetical protein ABI419_07055 [Ginsengibacter sp.]
MGLSEKKQTLLHIVEDADEKLTGLLIALATEYNSSSEEYTAEEIEEFYKVRDELINHPEKGYTVEDAHNLVRNRIRNEF